RGAGRGSGPLAGRALRARDALLSPARGARSAAPADQVVHPVRQADSAGGARGGGTMAAGAAGGDAGPAHHPGDGGAAQAPAAVGVLRMTAGAGGAGGRRWRTRRLAGAWRRLPPGPRYEVGSASWAVEAAITSRAARRARPRAASVSRPARKPSVPSPPRPAAAPPAA